MFRQPHENRFLAAFAPPPQPSASKGDLYSAANAIRRAHEKGAISQKDMTEMLKALLAFHLQAEAQGMFSQLDEAMERMARKMVAQMEANG